MFDVGAALVVPSAFFLFGLVCPCGFEVAETFVAGECDFFGFGFFVFDLPSGVVFGADGLFGVSDATLRDCLYFLICFKLACGLAAILPNVRSASHDLHVFVGFDGALAGGGVHVDGGLDADVVEFEEVVDVYFVHFVVVFDLFEDEAVFLPQLCLGWIGQNIVIESGVVSQPAVH